MTVGAEEEVDIKFSFNNIHNKEVKKWQTGKFPMQYIVVK